MSFLPPQFEFFLAPDCDRYKFLCTLLSDSGIDYSSIILEEKKHIHINFPKRAYNPLFRIKTIITHYDRVMGTPGANDNSAAVFQVLNFVQRLWQSPGFHNMRIIFTDGEELGVEQGVSAQGAFAIGAKFRKLGITNDDVFVFDGCGRGDVLVISTAGRNSSFFND